VDFADALHLVKTQGCSVFLSFDRKLIKSASGRSPIPVLTP
jgi:predicted nucleic-acid-binding protein